MQDHLIDGYMPHLVGGLKLERHWGAIATVLGYDSVFQEIAAKVRMDIRLGGPFTAFVMGGYQSDPEKPNYYGAWDGTYAAWSGLSASLSPKLTLNSQIAYADSGTYALAFIRRCACRHPQHSTRFLMPGSTLHHRLTGSVSRSETAGPTRRMRPRQGD